MRTGIIHIYKVPYILTDACRLWWKGGQGVWKDAFSLTDACAAFREKFGLVVSNSDFRMLRHENFGHKMNFPPKWKTWVEWRWLEPGLTVSWENASEGSWFLPCDCEPFSSKPDGGVLEFASFMPENRVNLWMITPGPLGNNILLHRGLC